MRHRETGVLLYDKGHATDGYTLIVPLVSKEQFTVVRSHDRRSAASAR